MLNALASELTAVLAILERCHAVEHFNLSLVVSRVPMAPSVAALLASLLAAVADCHARLEGLFSERPLSLREVTYAFIFLIVSHIKTPPVSGAQEKNLSVKEILIIMFCIRYR